MPPCRNPRRRIARPRRGTCVPAAEFRSALSRLATTVSVITTDGPAGVAGVTCSAVCALSDEPAMVLVCIHGKSATNAAIKANRVFCVNSLQAEQRESVAGVRRHREHSDAGALHADGLGHAGYRRAALHTRAGRPRLSKSQTCVTSARTVFSLPRYLRQLNRKAANRCFISGAPMRRRAYCDEYLA